MPEIRLTRATAYKDWLKERNPDSDIYDSEGEFIDRLFSYKLDDKGTIHIKLAAKFLEEFPEPLHYYYRHEKKKGRKVKNA